MSYVGTPAYNMQRVIYQFLATQGQTNFAGVDANGLVLAYTPGFVTAFVNGRRLSPGDYASSSGSSININGNLNAGDEVLFITEVTFNIANVYTQTQADLKFGTSSGLNDSRTLAILTSKLMGSIAPLAGGFADGFKSANGIDTVNSSGFFLDQSVGNIVGGVGPATLVQEQKPSIPDMVSSTVAIDGSSGHTATCSSNYNSTTNGIYDGYNAFCLYGDNGSTQTWDAGVNQYPAWLARGLPTPISVVAYAMIAHSSGTNYSPKDFLFQGANSPTGPWTTLDTRTGTPAFNTSSRVVFQVPAGNVGSYTNYRVYVTAGQATELIIAKLELLQMTPLVESVSSLPKMTSNNTVVSGESGHLAFASSENTATNQAWCCFNAETYNGSYSGSNTVWANVIAQGLPAWVARKTPNPIKVGSFSVRGYYDGTYSYYPIQFQLQASTDGVTWVPLLFVNYSVGSGYRPRYFVPQNKQGFYSYHRLYITKAGNNASDSANAVDIADFELLQVMSGIEAVSSLPLMTSNNSPTGYTTTQSGTPQTGYEPWRARDGIRTTSALTNGWSPGSSAPLPTTWIQTLPAPIKVLAYRMTSLGVYANYAWSFQGSNDGTTWTTLDDRSLNQWDWLNDVPVTNNPWGWDYDTGPWRYFTVKTPGTYSQYRFVITSGNWTDNYARLGEVEFLQGTSGAMDLRSSIRTINSAVTKGSLYLRAKSNSGSITANTNLVASMSRDGTTWTGATLTQGTTSDGFTGYEANNVDLSGQPYNASSSMRYRIQSVGTTLGLNIDGVDFRYS